ncbi:serine/threonine-protein phosphatase PP1-like isoform X2 [Varroa jacobsoni]|uniref:serine/threonine-protein phosphatase PP1-like isoform X2 n=1 Tax=Varroa jacobsoni TaxID=62625 RepID=UPI000BF79595|nr:serine/threonine-protein phosphatase PP1-like isoform X2 [Varroa jacobsoni]XP_022700122.1 serine/threonine-protein phosphatase PP1-like isoform X2 [Varroa jacobsoni]
MASKGLKEGGSGGAKKKLEMTTPTDKKKHEPRTKPLGERAGEKDKERHSNKKHLRINNAKDPRGKLDLDCLERRLLTLRKMKSAFCKMEKWEIMDLCDLVTPIFYSQPTLLDLDVPVHIVGDIHGQFSDLLRILEQGGFPPKTNYLFLGDYVDRGRASLEVIALLFIYKIRFPEHVFLLRGNHESLRINAVYGFFLECMNRFDAILYHRINEVFGYLPLAAVVGEKIFCCHGGLSPDLRDLRQVACMDRPIPEVPQEGLVCDLLWADPYMGSEWRRSDRGVSYLFGVPQLNAFLEKNNFDLLCRAHQASCCETVAGPEDKCNHCPTSRRSRKKRSLAEFDQA